ncbi:MAG: hypothetical protein H5U40_09060, partial [Polyangiaceae bacterium]|nr:hypothetical protein [Polyangiaceae bacterium]
APSISLPAWIVGSLVLVVALALSWLITALVTYPMGEAYQTRPAVTYAQLVGGTVTVTTSRVDARFGEAELRRKGPELVLQVRCTAPNALTKGSEALIIAWDQEREAFDVEPLDAIVGRRTDEERTR